tara:strand:- start:276 stop:497 length:222 start_codon:yes stop_codon:yes gene_type:complete
METDDLRADSPEEDGDRKPKGSGAVILGAAMIAVGEIIEPDKTNVEIAEVSDEHEPDPEQELKLDFGDLPPLS